MVQEDDGLVPSDDLDAQLRVVGIELLQSPDSLLGRSSRGHSVHMATWHGRTVAVKLSSSGGLLSPRDLPPHPNIARILASHSEPGRDVELRELCEGGELYDRIAEEGPLLAEEALDVFRQVANAMEHCHTHGLVHGQLRPEHVLLGAYDEVKLVGFTRPPPEASGRMVRLRPVRALDAPELQGRNDEMPSAELRAADVWSLGTLLLTMLNGEPPFFSTVGGACSRYSRTLPRSPDFIPHHLPIHCASPAHDLLHLIWPSPPRDLPGIRASSLAGSPRCSDLTYSACPSGSGRFSA